MPIFTLKKIQEVPDQDEEEVETMVEINVPDDIFRKILVKLNGRSLHRARQVSKEWNSFILEQVLGTVEYRREMERTLQQQWRSATPAMLEFTIGGQSQSIVLTLTDKFAVTYEMPSHTELFSRICQID